MIMIVKELTIYDLTLSEFLVYMEWLGGEIHYFDNEAI